MLAVNRQLGIPSAAFPETPENVISVFQYFSPFSNLTWPSHLLTKHPSLVSIAWFRANMYTPQENPYI